MISKFNEAIYIFSFMKFHVISGWHMRLTPDFENPLVFGFLFKYEICTYKLNTYSKEYKNPLER